MDCDVKNEYAIIVVAYNREKSLMRLLDSLNRAQYGEDRIPLIISIDLSENKKVRDVAEKFEWLHGEKCIRVFEKKQGLRQHVLQCGDYLKQYEAIAVFEDDLIVAPGYYQFLKEVVPFYKEDERIAGISLYSHRWNATVDRVFEPIRTDKDIFYMQYAQSWGQIWMRNQWNAFYEWYEKLISEEPGDHLDLEKIPINVYRWPKSSWLKYHIMYCVFEDKYFVYPYESLTTNCSEAGEHSRKQTWRYQVSMPVTVQSNYKLERLGNGGICYDAFFENQNLAQYLDIEESELCVDLYGGKPGNMGKKYWLTNKYVKGEKEKATFGLVLRPMDLNIVFHTEGRDFFLYESEKKVVSHKSKVSMQQVDYDVRREGFSLKNILRWIVYKLCNR